MKNLAALHIVLVLSKSFHIGKIFPFNCEPLIIEAALSRAVSSGMVDPFRRPQQGQSPQQQILSEAPIMTINEHIPVTNTISLECVVFIH